MRVHHCHHVWTGAVNFAMNEPLAVSGAAPRVDRIAVEIELHDVRRLDNLRSNGPREKEAVRIGRVSGAQVSVDLHHTLANEDVIAGDEVGDQAGIRLTRRGALPQRGTLTSNAFEHRTGDQAANKGASRDYR
jgi:hypothetical protein